ncbi:MULTISPECIES: hypothetical protein [unclassified Pseudomonas]|uniref:hypothetical protein n=1 Tax=unclassified Pseudomonas TaxID=196821 RepID=UPI001BCD489F|nr:hypothetical protein [Pseudomonas sp. Pc102]BBP83765.1 hypothetical protein PHLH8_34070 [Pseudomonas sp. Pc102]
MKSFSRSLLLISGTALAMLVVCNLVIALSLSRGMEQASQQTQVWKNYALAQQHNVLLLHTRRTSCCTARGEGHMEECLPVTELHAGVAGSQREQPRGLSF